ncbi:esterase-like activity of phytase family protein [Halomonas huangheensis]|uniref:Alkaline phosphatase n=1 Tax=Halomonas huangheensis TaxID=1178482 RepID=W1NCP6_9GAMM|nr:esterase-like activity of phytase family protein [Halomonas huangheensis]ALM50942.1 hypothetical protein AR456_00505 [Halomonas huangheensis]ERL53299.1 alkaline phosphatase [Halomonas huangheensis]
MPRLHRSLLCTGIATAGLSLSLASHAEGLSQIATFEVHHNLTAELDPETTVTAAEIITASADGTLLIYTDSPAERLGFIDITDPAAPTAGGSLALEGEPTSVSVSADTALVGVNTSSSYTSPSGFLGVVDLSSRQLNAQCDLGGQPDSVAISPDGSLLAVAIENERDEDHNDGELPQLPAGDLVMFDLAADGTPTNCEAPRHIDLTGLAEVAGDDPEPEFVDINDAGQVAVTLQENNHIVIVDGTSGDITDHFSAGSVDLEQVPTEKGSLTANGQLNGLAREPDAVGWLDNQRLVTANEGDYQGGSRGFTIFSTDGSVIWDSGNTLEQFALEYGAYPAGRAGKKGAEPEGIEIWKERELILVGLERAASVAVYRDMGTNQAPQFMQWLSTGVGPEGLLAIPQRDLFVVAAEEDDPEAGLRSTVNIYQWQQTPPAAEIIGADDNGEEIGFGALSGLSVDSNGQALLVSDSVYPEARLYQLELSSMPARIRDVTPVSDADGPARDLDLEGIAPAAGGAWLVSEGNPEQGRANQVLGVDADGNITERFTLPEVVAERMTRFGFEGIAALPGTDQGGERLAVIFQRALEGEEGRARLGLLDPTSGDWQFLSVALSDPLSPVGGWVGFSEITPLPDGRLALLERDNQVGERAALKRVVTISLEDATPVGPESTPPLLETRELVDLLPAMAESQGVIVDKPEAMSVDGDTLVVITDNDGVDDSIARTRVLRIPLPEA